VHKVYKVTTIVDDDIWSYLKNATDMLLVFLWSCVVPCLHVKTSLDERCCNIVLS
jgi:hypothetical protein